MNPKRSLMFRCVAALLALAFVGAACSGGGLSDIERELEERGASSPNPECEKDDDISPPEQARSDLTGRVGLIVQTNSSSWQQLTDAPEDRGVVITFVQPGGPSDGFGLQRGDVITSIDGEPSLNAERAVYLLRAEPGEERTIEVVTKAEGTTDELTVTAELPGDVNLYDMFGPMIEENPDDAVLRYLRAQSAPGFDEAMTDLDAAIERAPGFVEAISLRGEMRWNISRPGAPDLEISSEELQELRDQALADWDLALDLDSTNTRVLASRSQAHSQLGSWRQGMRDAEAALAEDETFPIAHYAIGLAELVSGSACDASEPLRRSIDLNPFDVRYYELLGLAFVQLGRREDSRRTIDAIIHLVDDGPTRDRLLEIPETEVSRRPEPPRGRTGSDGGQG